MTIDDAALIAQVRAGQRDAFRMLVVRYQGPMFRFLATFRLSAAQREELAQEAFLRAYRNLESYDASRAAFSSWLLVIAKNLALNEMARAHRREQPLQGLPEDSAAFSPPAGQAGAHAELEGAERRSLLDRALSSLPEVFRSALVFAYIHELSLENIATIENCSVGTVKSRIFRAKQMLREALAQWEN